MTVTVAEADAHRIVIDGIAGNMLGDLRDVWGGLDLSNPPQVQAFLAEFLPELGGYYHSQAASVSADWFADLWDAAGAPGIPRPVLDEPPPQPRFTALAGWGTTPLWSDNPLPVEALTRLTGAMTRVVRDGDRRTVAASADAARGTTWARRASAGACTFCRMLALRGGTYTTEASAGGGRLDQDYHDDCNCVVVPVTRGQGLEIPSYQRGWQEAYNAATSDVGASDPSKVLAHMRAAMGSS